MAEGMLIMTRVPCQRCNGTGKSPEGTACKKCQGAGKTMRELSFTDLVDKVLAEFKKRGI